MISEKSWQSEVRQIFKNLIANRSDARIAFLGVGNKLAGDDAVGSVIARNLLRMARPSPRLLILDGGPAPENFVGKLEAFAPDLVLIIDAADFDAVPGTVRLLDVSQISGAFPSTHATSIKVLSDYFRQSMVACAVYLLGIQPQTVVFDKALSPAAGETVQAVIQYLYYLIENP